MGLTGGAQLADLAAARVTMLRQYEKYEHTRADAEAALQAGRWRLAVLSARAALGFALDTLLAHGGRPQRDEIRRARGVAELLQRPADRRRGRHLLRAPVDEGTAATYVAACWRFIDERLAIGRLQLPGYYYGDRREEHVAMRREWLALAEQVGAAVPFAPGAVRQVLGAAEGDDGGSRWQPTPSERS